MRPSIIWCDSMAVPYGQQAFDTLGHEHCLGHLLNSPGNFTAAKLAWVKENEPRVFERIDKIMLPGDYIAMRLTGEACTTVSGLSEGMLWDFKTGTPATFLMEYYGFKGAGKGAGIYKDNNEAFATLDRLQVIEPDIHACDAYAEAYHRWKQHLETTMQGGFQ